MKQVYSSVYSSFCILSFSALLFLQCDAQPVPASLKNQPRVGGNCEGCEIMYIDIPPNIHSTDTSAGWWEAGKKLLVKGKVLKQDGKTPAPGVIVYYYQTDDAGVYSPRPGMNEKARRHGHIRGWVRSDKDGHYSIYTIRPMHYPNERFAAHIHVFIKEPDIANEYYIDELVFDDDQYLTAEERRRLPQRGGSGIMRTVEQNGLLVASHNIICGLNIPNYPVKK